MNQIVETGGRLLPTTTSVSTVYKFWSKVQLDTDWIVECVISLVEAVIVPPELCCRIYLANNLIVFCFVFCHENRRQYSIYSHHQRTIESTIELIEMNKRKWGNNRTNIYEEKRLSMSRQKMPVRFHWVKAHSRSFGLTNNAVIHKQKFF